MKAITVVALIFGLVLPFSAQAEIPAPSCDTPLDLIRLANPLSRLAQKLATHGPITIVAIGSSSTAGAGASSTAKNYPSQLAVELKRLFPTRSFTVLNRGANGEEVDDMLKRFDKDVVVAKPDLVLWQLGTNSVIRDQMFTDHGRDPRWHQEDPRYRRRRRAD
jgi:acyl-CoA thioesterase I